MEKKNQLKSCCKNGLSSPNTRPSSPRPCGRQERGIGAAHTLYPAFAARRVGMTERVCRVARMASVGFTLIELLVVVLIIGILAAVALPQYQRAIDKSRFMTYIQVLHGIKRAQETYYLANGFYAPSLKELDVDYTAGCTATSERNNMWTCPHGFYIDLARAYDVALGGLSVSLCPGHNTSYESCRDNTHASYHIYFDHYPDATKSGKTYCSSSTPRGEAICKSLQNM